MYTHETHTYNFLQYIYVVEFCLSAKKTNKQKTNKQKPGIMALGTGPGMVGERQWTHVTNAGKPDSGD